MTRAARGVLAGVGAAVVSFCTLPGVAASTPGPAALPGDSAPFTRIAEIKMSPELAGQSRPAVIEGVVIWSAAKGNFFIHDGELGIHVGELEAGKSLRPGDQVQVIGTTRRGSFAPSIAPQRLTRLGTAPVPEPQRVPYSAIASGSLDGAWLEIEGVVCAVDPRGTSGATVLSLLTEGRRLRVLVNDAEAIVPDQIVDALVRVHGVAGGKFNLQRQFVEPVLRLPGLSHVHVVQPPPPDPFALPLVPLTRLFAYSLEPPRPNRVRTRGVVTRQPSEHALYLRDEGIGVRVELQGPARFQPGDLVEVVGFPLMVEGSAVIQGAICRRVAAGVAVEPLRATWSELTDGVYTSNLVRLEARLVDWAAEEPGLTLALESGNHLFKAVLHHEGSPDHLLPPRNSIVEVTGISAISELQDRWSFRPRSVVLLLSDAADLRVLRAAPWWTPERLWRALIGIGVVLLVAAAWVWSLRQQVGRKRAIIERQARHAAVLEERSRIARELHDTLEQGLTGVSLQMKAMEAELRATDHPAGARLQFVRQALRQSRALARNAIRELRAEAIPPRIDGLVDGLKKAAEDWNRSGALEVRVRVAGTPRPLPPTTEHHLLRIGTEAMINAVKHGRAPAIDVDVDFRSSDVTLRVSDNGAGFDPAAELEKTSGCFGLLGMRERTREVGGEIQIQSRPGKGTQILVAAPLAVPGKAPAFG
jgi:signal transduction histidine kinase